MKRTVRLGNTGPEVADLQLALVALGQLRHGYYKPGTFDGATGVEVVAFQRAHGLVADGVVGPKTWAAIEAAVPAEMPDWGTAGGEAFVDGWWSGARRVPAHPGRVGGAIEPWSVVVHTTDCAPGTFATIVRSWSSRADRGACAHFIFGRSEADGVVQMVPIDRNGNHAGGTKLVDGRAVPWHGDYKVGSALVHPNRVAIGIELDCAGYLGKRVTGRGWVHPDSGVVIPDADVYVDEKRVGWHCVTDYQLATLEQFLRDVEPELRPVPQGASIVPNGAYAKNGVPWATPVGATPRVVGHVTLNPNNKTDPGPQVMDWIGRRLAP